MHALIALLLAALAPHLTAGPPPEVPYAFAAHPTFGAGDWRLVRPGGSSAPFTQSLGSFAAYDEVVVNGYGTEAGARVELFDATPTLEHEQDGLCHFGLVTTPERDEVAWLQDDGTLVEQHADGSLDTRPVELPGDPCGGLDAVALRGPKLYVDSARSAPYVVSGSNHPTRLRLLRDLSDVSHRGLLAGRLAAEPRCWGLLRPGRGVVWQTCTDRLESFAPHGRRVLGSTRDGLVVHAVSDGAVVARWDAAPRQRLAQVAWEDARHLLLVVRHPAVGWSVIRLGVDGRTEYAVAPVRTGAEYPPFRLPMS